MPIGRRKKRKDEGGIPVTLEIGTPLASLTTAKGITDLEERLASHLNHLASNLGLSGRAAVTVQQVVSQRAIQLRINGSTHPYEPQLMKRVWVASVPSDQRQVPDAVTPDRENGFPDRWLADYVEKIGADNKALGVVVDFLVRLAVEAIAERPSSLVREEDAETYFEHIKSHSSATALSIFPADLSLILRSIFDLGIRPHKPALLEILILAQEHGLSVEDTIESVFTQLRSSRLEIHAHPDYIKNLLNPSAPASAPENGESNVGAVRQLLSNILSRLTQEQSTSETPIYSELIGPNVQSLFRGMEEQLFLESGLRLPDLVWVNSTQVPDGFVALKINDWLSVPVMALLPGEMFVDQLAQAWMVPGEPARPAIHPRTGLPGNVVKENLEQPIDYMWGLTNPMEFVLAILSQELLKNANRLFGVEDTEYQLAQLNQSFPRLIEITTSRLPMAEITRVLRRLLSEGLPVRNTWLILEKLLSFDAVPLDSIEQLILDDRMPVLTENGEPQMSVSEARQEFARAASDNYLSYRYRQRSGNVRALVLTDEEPLATSMVDSLEPEAAFDERQLERFKDELWTEIAKTERSEPLPVLLTSPLIRRKIRDLIAAELSELPVVSFNEIPPSKIGQTVSISLTGRGQSSLENTSQPAAHAPVPSAAR